MPRKAKRELVCKECGKKFIVEMNDAIMPKDAELLENPICKICALKNKIKK